MACIVVSCPSSVNSNFGNHITPALQNKISTFCSSKNIDFINFTSKKQTFFKVLTKLVDRLETAQIQLTNKKAWWITLILKIRRIIKSKINHKHLGITPSQLHVLFERIGIACKLLRPFCSIPWLIVFQHHCLHR